MTTPAGSQHVGIVMTARDNASRNIGKVRQSLGGLGKSLKSAALSVVSFSAIISGLGVSIVALVALGTRWVKNVIDTNRAVSRLGVTLRSSGFSADFTNKRLREMKENLDKLTIQTLPGLAGELQKVFLDLTPKSQTEIQQMAKNLAKITGIDYKAAFTALNEGLTGNLDPLHKLGLEGDTFAEVLADLQEKIDFFKENQSSASKLWDGFKDGLGLAGDAVGLAIELMSDYDVAVLAATKSAGDALSKFGDSIDGWLTSKATAAWDAVARFFTGDDEETGMDGAGESMAKKMMMGFFDWLIGEDAVEIISLGFKGNWSGAWELLKTKVPEWGKGLAKALIGGVLEKLGGKPFKDSVIAAFQGPDGLWAKMKSLWPEGESFGKSLGMFIGNALISAVEGAINLLARKVQAWINKTVQALNSIPGGGGITAPSVPLASFGRFGAAPRPRGGGPGTARLEQPVTVILNGREVARAMMEVVDGELRIRQPGLAIN